MLTLAWQLNGHVARLTLGRVAGSLDLLRPADGLVDVRQPEGPLVGARLLGIGVPGFGSVASDSLIECHARGRDLVLAYRESAGWPARLDVLWRACAEQEAFPAMELVLGVRTYARECRPGLSVRSLIQAEEVLAVAGDARARPLPATPEGRMPVDSAAPSCVVFRLAGAALSYVQMVHPSAFQRDELLREPDAVVPVQLRHQLFPPLLEKGVILQARIRACFVPREDDLALAATAARSFAASEPPLS